MRGEIDISDLCRNCCSYNNDELQECPVCGQSPKEPARVDAEALPPGTILGQPGRFFVGQSLGRGGFGITYVAYDLMMMRRVAIKEFFPSEIVSRTPDSLTVEVRLYQNLARFTKERDRFSQEARTLAQLTEHPGFTESAVLAYDVFDALNTTYLVMRLVSGKTLTQVIEQGLPSPRKAIGWSIEILTALRKLHQINIVHRDIKPSNLILSDEGRIVILDFGAARMISHRPYTALVTPGFAAPEAFQPGQPDMTPAMDIYSVGATLLYLLTGEVPDGLFDGQRIVPMSAMDKGHPKISQELYECIHRALAFNWRERFSSAEQFEQGLLKVPEMSTSATIVRSRGDRSQIGTGLTSRLKMGLACVGLSWLLLAYFSGAPSLSSRRGYLVTSKPPGAILDDRLQWEESVRNVLVGLFDDNHSHLIDTPQEAEKIKCSLYRRLLRNAQDRGLIVSLVADYRFGPLGEFRGYLLGYGERVRGRVFRKLRACGLSEEK